MKLGSLFDGSGGFPLAGSLCGIEPVWASEIEPYPIAVTRSRFPNMKHFGDISKINGAEVEPVDIITFGSPCQDLSVAGKRAGLKHEANGDEETTRSGLFMEAVRIIKEMREATNGEYPSFALWENVPGAFSSNKGEDFRIVLEELIKIVEPTAVMPEVPKGGWAYADSYCGAGWSIAYRVFDAQYWGVPQRRRRIHLVLDLRGERAQEVLFEREGVRGYFAEGRTPWQAAPTDAERGVGADDREGNGVTYAIDQQGGKGSANYAEEIMPTLCSDSHGTPHAVAYPADAIGLEPVTFEPGILRREGGHIYEGVAGTLRANAGDNQLAVAVVDSHILDDQGGQQISVRTDGKTPTLRAEMHGNVPCVMDAAGFCPEQSAKTRGIGWEEEMAPTLWAGVTPGVVCKTWDARGNGDGDICNTITGDHENRITDYTSVICLQGNGIDRADTAGCNGKGWKEDVAYTLNTIDRPAVCYTLSHGGFMVNPSSDGIADTLQATDYKDPQVVAIDRAAFNQGQNAQYDPQFYTDGTTSTLVARGPSAVAYGVETFHCTHEEEKVPTLKARDWKDPHVVCYWDGSQTCGTLTANNAGGNQRMPDKENFNCVLQMGSGKPVTGCLMASGYEKLGAQEMFSGDYTVVENSCIRYIVRRLTPTECARLQGFPDAWGHIGTKEDLTDEEWTFWAGVRNTHAAINGKLVKKYTKAQLLTWYNKLHTDSAEYKMWGNGIALPPALYCMQGIVEACV